MNPRAGYPAYALSRGASSASLSTSPCFPKLSFIRLCAAERYEKHYTTYKSRKSMRLCVFCGAVIEALRIRPTLEIRCGDRPRTAPGTSQKGRAAAFLGRTRLIYSGAFDTQTRIADRTAYSSCQSTRPRAISAAARCRCPRCIRTRAACASFLKRNRNSGEAAPTRGRNFPCLYPRA